MPRCGVRTREDIGLSGTITEHLLIAWLGHKHDIVDVLRQSRDLPFVYKD
ncbi:MAG: hypothetical protein IMF26_04955 [Candidatus Fermentithermobacillus carboniphilus]|uniref:Uncharacterized protein n=1 Tax=Candidatus Fermentithermobacillus carboniphilus TaxID=3085328 RepID=A0AAT9LEB2_9FIRM|nr:MAG: hypothetical protein IMF26_04955 [Candidatus Fermentithermobacillus carboniphilus]